MLPKELEVLPKERKELPKELDNLRQGEEACQGEVMDLLLLDSGIFSKTRKTGMTTLVDDEDSENRNDKFI